MVESKAETMAAYSVVKMVEMKVVRTDAHLVVLMGASRAGTMAVKMAALMDAC